MRLRIFPGSVEPLLKAAGQTLLGLGLVVLMFPVFAQDYGNTLQPPLAGLSVKACQNQSSQLAAAAHKLIANKTTPETVNNWLDLIEQPLIAAHNLMFRSYLFYDVAPETKQREVALACLRQLTAATDSYLQSITKAGVLVKASGALDKSTKTPWLAQAKSALAAYQRGSVNLEDQSLHYKALAKSAGDRFRKVAADKGPFAATFTGDCLAHAVEIAPEIFAEAQGLIDRQSYNRLLKLLPSQTCREMLYRDYQRRHQSDNQDNLLDFIQAKANQAHWQRQHSWTEGQLRESSFQSFADVLGYLNLLHQQNQTAQTEENRSLYAAPWDLNYDAAQGQVHKSKFSPTTKQSLPKEQVLSGMFELLAKEFGLTVKQLSEPVVWHQDVRAYALYGDQEEGGIANKFIGYFYLDLHPREGKYSKNRHRAIQRGVLDEQGIIRQFPASALVLNLPKKNWRQRHIKSLFHELGHVLHNLLSIQRFHQVSGISISRDLVELPAKVFELISFQPDMQKAYLGAELVPQASVQRGTRYNLRIFKAAQALVYYRESGRWQEQQMNKAARLAQLETVNAILFEHFVGYPYPAGASSQFSFSHLATYGPRYYSYLLSEQLAQLLLDDIKTGRISHNDLIKHLFMPGGSHDAAHMLSNLYGKPSTIMQLLASDIHQVEQ